MKPLKIKHLDTTLTLFRFSLEILMVFVNAQREAEARILGAPPVQCKQTKAVDDPWRQELAA